jgi:DNA recombination protein RmuC
MDVWHWALGILLLAAWACVAWLIIARQKLIASEAAAKAILEQSQGETNRVRIDLQKLIEEERARLERASRALEEAQREARALDTDIAGLRAERDAERARLIDELRQKDELLEVERGALRKQEHQFRDEMQKRISELNEVFASKFDALAGEALKKANSDYLARAEERFGAQQKQAAGEIELKKKAFEDLIKPIVETLGKTEARLTSLDKERIDTAAAIRQQLETMSVSSASLRDETAKLVRALREPQVRGRYGEVQLRRVAELAGLRAYCDFAEQESTRDAEGNLLRPDMVVKLPNGRELAVDAKANLKPYLDAIEAAADPARAEEHLRAFANGVADQAEKLSSKGYWKQYASPQFVVMFVPGDQFVDAALARRPDLLEFVASRNVVLASPSTLIGLLHAVAMGHREDKLAQSAKELQALGIEFHERAAIAMGHVLTLGRRLNSAVECYNEFVGSYEKRLEPTLRKFAESGASGSKELPAIEPVVVRARAASEPQRLLLESNEP